jgi:hypothetical protein
LRAQLTHRRALPRAGKRIRERGEHLLEAPAPAIGIRGDPEGHPILELRDQFDRPPGRRRRGDLVEGKRVQLRAQILAAAGLVEQVLEHDRGRLRGCPHESLLGKRGRTPAGGA